MCIRLFGITILACALGGCAFTNPDNTPLLTALDGAIQPESTWAKIAMGPVFVPVGVTCGVLDVAAVHPARALAFAGQDTWRVVWANPSGSFAQQAALALPKAVVTPVVYVFCWIGECLFDLRPQKAKESS